MVDSEHLTYIDCPYYKRISAGDYSQSVCDISGKVCDADEAGLECSMWEEEKAEILKETGRNEMTTLRCPNCDVPLDENGICPPCEACAADQIVGLTVESTCPNCSLPVKVVADVYKIHNQDGSLHTCWGYCQDDFIYEEEDVQPDISL